MASLRIVKRYALALFRSSQAEGTTDKVLSDLMQVKSAINASKDLRVMLHSPVIRTAVKVSVLTEIFGTSLSKLSLDFMIFLAEKGREPLLAEAIESFESIYNEANGILKVGIVSATQLSEDMRSKIVAMMAKTTGKRIEPNFSVDSSLIGGLRIRVADMLYDGSVTAQLATLYGRLSGTEMSTELQAKIAMM